MACTQCRSEPNIIYDTDYVSLMLAPPTCSSAPGELLRFDAMCICDSEDLDWSYSEEYSFRSRLTN